MKASPLSASRQHTPPSLSSACLPLFVSLSNLVRRPCVDDVANEISLGIRANRSTELPQHILADIADLVDMLH